MQAILYVNIDGNIQWSRQIIAPRNVPATMYIISVKDVIESSSASWYIRTDLWCYCQASKLFVGLNTHALVHYIYGEPISAPPFV